MGSGWCKLLEQNPKSWAPGALTQIVAMFVKTEILKKYKNYNRWRHRKQLIWKKTFYRAEGYYNIQKQKAIKKFLDDQNL